MLSGVISARLRELFGPSLADWPDPGREVAIVENPGPHDGSEVAPAGRVYKVVLP